MPYTIQIRPINLGNTFPAPLAISGSLANNPGAVLETVTAVATGFGPDLNFVSAATPPRGSGTAYIGNSRNSGDLCRSGVVFNILQ